MGAIASHSSLMFPSLIFFQAHQRNRWPDCHRLEVGVLGCKLVFQSTSRPYVSKPCVRAGYDDMRVRKGSEHPVELNLWGVYHFVTTANGYPSRLGSLAAK